MRSNDVFLVCEKKKKQKRKRQNAKLALLRTVSPSVLIALQRTVLYPPFFIDNWCSSMMAIERYMGLSTPGRRSPGREAYFSDSEMPHGSGHGSVVDGIIHDRSQQNGMNSRSSPLKPGTQRKERRDELSRQRRLTKREEKMMEKRGGLDKMEDFIMRSEREKELEELEREAVGCALSDQMIEALEEEQRMMLEDEELIKFVTNKEVYEMELENLLSELSME
ncbi:Rtt105p KNAG_0C03510 [Huiozyma naganishii CBS 8797]|uniref:Uncharacterized protein n=1 Tax=Huiozyma naganishii (strain ATCC MYA-139 / BCRC 22969 / CBS 8797 / KCTC 17520 / NBRC 10181 / NCYC 3082 / Yp74L-3) TaxID=1071383 RepID=J7S602_HUIN7|nr:hypothetical protein KNAG_0C03510 [Kazachstania naganishii CBS 8797]CCK69456.1 hypothetical protein KNAG_0C03510 [Kazachstania naganishii CBS 8797]